jgi:hypothetical protein
MKVLLSLLFIILEKLFTMVLNSKLHSYKSYFKDMKIPLSYYVEHIILHTLPEDMIDDEYLNYPICRDKIKSLDQNSEDLMKSIFYSSFDYRNSEDIETCLLEDKLNVLVKFYYFNPNVLPITFTEQYTNLCIFWECENVINLLLDKKNKKLEKYFEDQFKIDLNINDFRIMRRGEKENVHIIKELSELGDKTPPYGTKKKIFTLKVILIVFYLYLGFRVFILIFNRHISKNRVFLKLLTRTLKFLFKYKNILYDEKNLDRFSFLFSISLFGINYHILISTYIFAPLNKLKFNEIERLTVLKMLDRLSCHAFYLYIILKGLTFSFKLLTYLQNKEKSLKNFLKFYLKNVFNLLFFFLVFLFYNSFYRELFSSIVVKFNPTPKNIHYLYWNSCNEESILEYFIPFYINYKNFNISERCHIDFFVRRHPCNIDYLLLSSEFYLFSFFMILVYLLYKMKSKIIEKGIIILFFLFYLMIIIIEPYIRMDYWISTEYPFFKFPFEIHNLICPYFLGIVAGILFYYHKNLMLFVSFKELQISNGEILETSEKVRNRLKEHFPFKFLLKLNKYFHKKSESWIKAIRLISWILVLLNVSVSSCNESILNLDLFVNQRSFYIVFYFINDSHIFILIIFFYLLMDFYEDKSFLNKYFIVLNRCCLPFLLNCMFVSGLIYLNIDNNKMKGFYVHVIIAMGNFIITFFFAIFFQVMFLIPLKFLWRKYFI